MISIGTAMSCSEPIPLRRTASVGIPLRSRVERTRSLQWLLISRVTRRLPASSTSRSTVSLSSPANNAYVTGTFAVSAAATDNVAITKVEFYLDNVLLTTDTSSPYTFNWNSTTVTQGAHIWQAIAQDGAGFRTTSATTAITVDNTAPTVAITSPANGAAILPNAIVNIDASASDNFGVVKVEF